jgi:hypothetical protein
MGIDVYLKWNGMTEEDKQRQYTGMSTIAGNVGYLREAYHGGPYATKILCREAFEAEKCEAQIPAATLRERLTSITEPAYGCDGGHTAATMLAAIMQAAAAKTGGKVHGVCNPDGRTTPMTVEEAVRTRYAKLYPEEDAKHVEEVVQSFRDFVALAEQKEAEIGRPCTIYASY